MNCKPIHRREIVTGVAAAAATLACPGLVKSAMGAQKRRKTLKILQWRHFVPAFDEWFNNEWIKEWGEKNDTEVIVDHVGMSSLRGRAKAQVSAGAGHDLFLFLSPPPAYEDYVIDHREIYEECARIYGKPLDIGIKSTFNPKTNKYYGFSDSYVPDPVNYRHDLWQSVGMKPDSWDEIRTGAKLIREHHGISAGFGMAPELDTNMGLRSLLASFGAGVQSADGQPTFKSKQSVEAIRFLSEMYKESMTDEVFTWDPSSNNRMMLAGRGSVALNAISITRTGESQKIPIHKNIWLAPPAEGPAGRIGLYHLLNVYVIWKFAQNIDGAKQFLVDYSGQSRKIFLASQFYNAPCFPSLISDLPNLVADDQRADPGNKYKLFENTAKWTTNVGHPGYANAATDEIFNSWIISTAFANAARGKLTPEAAVDEADAAIRGIFAKWKAAGKV